MLESFLAEPSLLSGPKPDPAGTCAKKKKGYPKYPFFTLSLNVAAQQKATSSLPILTYCRALVSNRLISKRSFCAYFKAAYFKVRMYLIKSLI